MRYFFIFFALLSSFLYAKNISVNKLIDDYKNGEYKKVCLNGIKIFYKLEKDESLISMYGISCLKSDYIDRLAVPAVALKKTKSGRKNAILFLTIMLQKKILISSLFDNFKISNIKLPDTNYILSKIFRLYQEKKYRKNGNELIFQDLTKKNIQYKLILKKDKEPKILLLELNNNEIVKKHIYW